MTDEEEGVRRSLTLAADVPPPPDLPQPVTLLLAADPSIAEGYCTGSDAGRLARPDAEARH